MNPSNGMISPPVPKTPGNHGRYRHIHLGAYVRSHHVSFPIRLIRIAHSHDVLDSSLHTPDQYGLCTAMTIVLAKEEKDEATEPNPLPTN